MTTATLQDVQQQTVNQLSQVLNATQDLLNHAGQIGQVAWQTTLKVTQINCLSNLLVWGAFIISFIAFTTILITLITKDLMPDDHETGTGVFMFFLAGIIASLWGAIAWSSLWDWIGLFHPDLYLAHQALEKVLGS